MPQEAPYGSWKSPITSDLIVSETVGIGSPVISGEDVYWLEMRPREKGRYVVVKRDSDGETTDINPAPMSARTRVHEYGGASFIVDGEAVYFSNFADGRLYRADGGAQPEALTPDGDMRFADMTIDAARSRIILVLEDHRTAQPYPANSVAAVPAEGGEPEVLVSGADFYSNPRLSPDGRTLAWLSWNHPNMPWDGTELWTAEVLPDGALGTPRKVAGGPDESIFQPQWSPQGVLYFVSDRSGWWNLYRTEDGEATPLCPMEAEFGMPQWVFGMSTYAFLPDGKILSAYTKDGVWHLVKLGPDAGAVKEIETPYSMIGSLSAAGGRAVFVAASPSQSSSIVRMDTTTLASEVLKRSTNITVEAGYLSTPEPVEFPTEGGLTAHALFYPPQNADFAPPAGELPPLLVHIHGGPTSAASSALSLSTQYWTSRGIAVADVNYGGSTGYGREYRRRLDGNWGVVDVDDCVNVAKHLVESGRADGKRLAIAGGSAGGYTTLSALAFRDVFHAGASHYGVSDAEALATDTHKFESRYLDRLIGPYPAERERYVERSPIHFPGQLSCPVIFFQGLEDKIVPPDQAEKMVEALRDRGVPVAYVAFEGEQHGFRQAEHIKRALDGEFYFYSRVFGFEPAEDIEPVEIMNI